MFALIWAIFIGWVRNLVNQCPIQDIREKYTV